MESFNGSLSFESLFEIQGHGGVGLVVLKFSGDDLEWNVNREQKGFVCMGHI